MVVVTCVNTVGSYSTIVIVGTTNCWLSLAYTSYMALGKFASANSVTSTAHSSSPLNVRITSMSTTSFALFSKKCTKLEPIGSITN